MRHLLTITLLVVFLLGCEQSGSPDIDRVAEGITSSISKAGQTLDRYTPTGDDMKRVTVDELEKLFLYEYRVDDLPPNITANELEQHLATLGTDRWDCFFIDRLPSELRVHCKRHPKSYLRYLLHFR